MLLLGVLEKIEQLPIEGKVYEKTPLFIFLWSSNLFRFILPSWRWFKPRLSLWSGSPTPPRGWGTWWSPEVPRERQTFPPSQGSFLKGLAFHRKYWICGMCRRREGGREPTNHQSADEHFSGSLKLHWALWWIWGHQTILWRTHHLLGARLIYVTSGENSILSKLEPVRFLATWHAYS